MRQHECSFSIPSARYTDKADGQAGKPANRTAKPTFRQCAGEVGDKRSYCNTTISASTARQPSIR
ncbi:hypothetical protein PT7_2865 [Pusillimonas sp. T7-7]|nr:hypothetical protein PT7_2865 [Pusillimonas sp. T7-7]